MRIILAPAKKMKVNTDDISYDALPVLLHETEQILEYLIRLSDDELKRLWKCNDKIAQENIFRIRNMNLRKNLTPAILSYEGIAYQYMAPIVFENAHFDYVERNLRILSGFYGVLKPLDGVVPYRLEMQAKAEIGGLRNLYDFWGDKLYKEVRDDSGIIINLASKEYSKGIEKYLIATDRYITVEFVEEHKGKLVTKGTYAKMARGEMVRFMAENNVENPEDIKEFDRLGYCYRDDLSDEKNYFFEKRAYG